MNQKTFVTTLVLLFLSAVSLAHDGDHHTSAVRYWSLASGKTRFDGTFVSATGQQVSIRMNDGYLLKINMNRLSEADQKWVKQRQAEIARINQNVVPLLVNSQQISTKTSTDSSARRSIDDPAIAKHFEPFAKKIKYRWDKEFFYVQSNGMPDHDMMVGIRAWQQQIPIPQNYTGRNAWRIPLNPVPAKKPLSAKSNFFRGAIALGVNGVPIFNPIKNDGRTDTFLAGELDKFGGHCGRADDYHYHLPPVHLEKIVGRGKPIAYALDGYPILGFQSKEEARKSKLDWLNGHQDENGNYHYHATKKYPYLNGGFYGQVSVRGGQVDPQPRSQPIRPAERPLRGATITGFSRSKDGKKVSVQYKYGREKRSISYITTDFKTYRFTYDNGSSGKRSETYVLRNDGRSGDDRKGGKRKRRRR